MKLLSGAFVLALTIISFIGMSVQAEELVDAVSYREDGGIGLFDRKIDRIRENTFMIDINSRIEIRIDGSILQSKLQPFLEPTNPDVLELRDRCSRLTEAVENVTGTFRQLKNSADEYEKAMISNDPKDLQSFIGSAQEAAANLIGIFEPLKIARRARLRIEKYDADDIEKLMESFTIKFSKKGGDAHFAMKALKEEIDWADKRLGSMLDEIGLRIEISGGLQPRGGEFSPIHLENYDSVEICEVIMIPKMRFSLSDDEKMLRKQYTELAIELNEANTVRKKFEETLRAVAGPAIKEIEDFIAALKSLRDPIESAMSGLEELGDRHSFDAFIQSIPDQLRESNHSKAVVDVLDSFNGEIGEIEANWNSLRELAAFPPPNNIRNALQAYDYIIKNAEKLAKMIPDPQIWTSSIARIETLIDAVRLLATDIPAMADSNAWPIAPAQKIENSINELMSQTKLLMMRVTGAVKLATEKKEVDELIGQIPKIEGQKRLLLSIDINSSFDLTTICAEREAGDYVRLSYKFFAGGTELDCSFRHRFMIGEFGWQSQAYASLGLTQRDHASKWNYQAPVSVLLTHRSRPNSNFFSKLPDYLFNNRIVSGIGLTMLTLNYQDEESLELAFAPTIGFLSNRILLGYGWNTRADERKGFWLIGLRFLDFTSQLGFGGTERNVPELH